MNNHNLNLETCSMCIFLKGCYPDYHSTPQDESKVLIHLLEEHHINLLASNLIFINDIADETFELRHDFQDS